jgi:hypothetical protein
LMLSDYFQVNIKSGQEPISFTSVQSEADVVAAGGVRTIM